MDRGMIIFLGCLFTFSSAWVGLVLAPNFQMGEMQPAAISGENEYPRSRTELELEGKRIYEANGCLYCHSQQVRPGTFGNNADMARGWGKRRSVPRDYINDRPILLGTMRTGPDLANVGSRDPARLGADWHHKHLYNPRMMVPGSIMPPFKFLYEVRPIADGKPSPEAIALTGTWETEIPANHEVVPTDEAKALIAYLLSLDQYADLPEAKE
jgi:cytochrome c oxidase cbb3-type subunit 2